MIEVSHVQKSYGRKHILTDISFCAKPGECIAIVGKNGCGKSTLLQILSGVTKADGGSIRLWNEEATAKTIRRYCGYVPQENPLMEEMSVRDNLRLWQGKNRQMEAQIIRQFDLSELLGQKVKTLSGGMKRRLAIACTLLKLPPVMIMDEPTTALDLYYKESIRQWMKQYLAGNGTIIMTTHDESEIASATRCRVMRDGIVTETPKILVRDAILSEKE